MKNSNNIIKQYSILLEDLSSKGFDFDNSLHIEDRLNNFETTLSKEFRKKHGVVYTPSYIAEAMIDNALDILLLNIPNKIEFLESIKILDPCCGAGIFTIKILDKLMDIWKELEGENKDRTYKIIKNNIYFCDLDKNAVEITKTRLWGYISYEVEDIKEFKCNGYCGDFIDGSIDGYGTFLMPDYKIDGGFEIKDIDTEYNNICYNNTIKYNKAADCMIKMQGGKSRVKRGDIVDACIFFRQDIIEGGFNLIIGNPPYVSTKDYKENKDYFRVRYRNTFNATNDLCIYFFNKAWDILKDGGVISFITTNTWMNSSYATNFRKWLETNSKLYGLHDFVRTMPFKDAGVTVAISVLKKDINEEIKYSNIEHANESNLIDIINNSKTYKHEAVYKKNGIEFLNEMDIKIQNKFECSKNKYLAIKDYCDGFKVGLLTGNIKLYTNIDSPGKEFLTDELRDKYPNIIRRAYKPYRNTGKKYWNLLYIQSGEYKDINDLPEEIKDYILEYEWEFKNRDNTTIGDEWYSLKHGINRVNNGVTHGIMSAYKPLLIEEIESDSIVLDTTTIFTKIESENSWIVDYINNNLIEALYNKCINCLAYPNSSVPRKQSKEINEFPVVCRSNKTIDIAKGFNLTNDEVRYLLDWNSEAIK